jgi:ribonucleases P/MRP protein subunit RPP40
LSIGWYGIIQSEVSHFGNRLLIKGSPQYGYEVNQKCIDFIVDHDLTQVVNMPTRIATNINATANILDVGFTNIPERIDRVLVNDGVADHKIVDVFVKMLSSVSRTSYKKRAYLYHKADVDGIKGALQEKFTSFVQLSHVCCSINDLWNTFCTDLLSIQESFVPSKMFSSSEPPWMNREIKKLKRKCRDLYKSRHASPECETRYKQVFYALRAAKQTAEEHYLQYTLDEYMKCGSSKFFQYLQAKRTNGSFIPTLVDKSGNKIVSDKDKVSVLNQQFSSVYVNENLTDIPELAENCDFPGQASLNFSSEDIVTIVKSISSKKAPGPDNVHIKLLKLAPVEISHYLKVIFDKSLELGVVPDAWKTANIVPIPKKGLSSDPAMYRPISLTSLCCKILEKLITNDIMSYLTSNNILHPLQHGFRNQHSCETQLLNLLHELSEHLDCGRQVDLIFLDFAKAFDTVPHKRLLLKLKHYKLHTGLITWIENYLTNRTHSVVLNGVVSESQNVLSGVPQGSVLGPLLFLLFINDLPDSVLSTLRLFADDGLLSKVISSAADAIALQQDLNECDNWSQKWLLKYNVGKCESMTVTRKQTPINTDYTLQSNVLKTVGAYKYLGVLLDAKLNLNAQVAAASGKAMKMLYFIHRNLKNSTPAVRERAYMVFVRPIIEYSAAAWDPYTDSAIRQLERVQRKAIRIVTQNFDRSETTTDSLLSESKWLSLEDRRKISRLTSLLKCKSSYPGLQELQEKLLPPMYISSRVDHCYKIREIDARTSQYKNSFLPRTIKDWNSLPESVFRPEAEQKFCTVGAFRNRLKAHFGEHVK